MGMFFSDIHCRKTDAADLQTVRDAMIRWMADAGYTLTESEDDSEIMYLCTSDCGWVSVYCDAFSFGGPEDTEKVLRPLSDALHTDVMAAACFDSDYLFLHLRNTADGTDAWANIGRNPAGAMPRRTNLAAWKNKVADHEAFKAAVRSAKVFAEDFFSQTEAVLGLPYAQACLCDEPDIVPSGEGFVTETLRFQRPASAAAPEEPKLDICISTGNIHQMGVPKSIYAVNRGGASRGLAIAFSGDYVEHEEIRIENVKLEYGFDRPSWSSIPLTPEKRQTMDGRYVYYCEAPNFKLPEKVDENLGAMRRAKLEIKRSFRVRFTPVGDAEKAGSITVHFIPLKATPGKGQCVWNALTRYIIPE